jgi:hypothetical protein
MGFSQNMKTPKSTGSSSNEMARAGISHVYPFLSDTLKPIIHWFNTIHVVTAFNTACMVNTKSKHVFDGKIHAETLLRDVIEGTCVEISYRLLV